MTVPAAGVGTALYLGLLLAVPAHPQPGAAHCGCAPPVPVPGVTAALPAKSTRPSRSPVLSDPVRHVPALPAPAVSFRLTLGLPAVIVPALPGAPSVVVAPAAPSSSASPAAPSGPQAPVPAAPAAAVTAAVPPPPATHRKAAAPRKATASHGSASARFHGDAFGPTLSRLTPVVSVLILMVVVLIPCAAAAASRFKRLR